MHKPGKDGEKTWDDLKKEGALLGERGWTDGVKDWKDEKGLIRRNREKTKAERFTDTLRGNGKTPEEWYLSSM
jgi:hypothetical protein